MQNIFIPLIFFILLNSTVSVVSKEKFGTALPFTFILSSFVMYPSGYLFGTFNIGLSILVILSVASVPLYLISIKKGYIDSLFISKNIFTIGFVSFIFIFIVWGIIDYGSFFRKWDELSHWGVMIKEMLRLDDFYSLSESTLNWHKEYPPIIQCFELLWVKLGAYSETALRISVQVLTLSLPVIWVDENNEENNKVQTRGQKHFIYEAASALIFTDKEQILNLRPAILKDNNSSKYIKLASKLEQTLPEDSIQDLVANE